MTFSVTILGSNSALPTTKRYPTAQVLNVSERFFLIDCGEGTQLQLRSNKIKFSRINNIFISHLHGDHVFGLIGLISTFGLLGRTNDLHIYAHSDLETLLQPQIDYFCNDLGFKPVYHHLNTKEPETIFEDKSVTVTSFPLKHRVPTCGFLFREKQKEPNIRKEAITKYSLGIADIVKIKRGEPFFDSNGQQIYAGELILPPPPPRSYAFCSDTGYNPAMIPVIKNVDLLYHEATFAEEHKELAKKTTHSTARQAAEIAKEANAGKLILGHFSSRYDDLSVIENEAREIFPETYLVNDGDVWEVK
ncbi:MAG: ribonuclease Z [Chlorobi bacterium]|nr:ribonuclease Z [Chlorobiota bacterium]